MLIVLHDILLLVPLCLISFVLGPYRIPKVVNLFRNHYTAVQIPEVDFVEARRELENVSINNQEVVVSEILSRDGQLTEMRNITHDSDRKVNSEDQMNKFEKLTDIKGNIRSDLWIEIFETMMDLPFHVLSFIGATFV